jgi:hypothetical protein
MSALQLQNRLGLGSYRVGKVRIGGTLVGNQPGLRSEGAEHESLEFLLAKVLDHLQPSTSAILSSASTRPLRGVRHRAAHEIIRQPSLSLFGRYTLCNTTFSNSAETNYLRSSEKQ